MRFANVRHFMELMGLPNLSKPRFNANRNAWLYPVIYRIYTAKKQLVLDKLRAIGSKLVLCGDAQFDSPGYTAKYCTYTVMCCDTDEILDFIIIQKGQYHGELEKQACELLLNILINDEKLKIESFVTDRHTAIGAMMNSDFSDVYHAFDIWHMAKSLVKQLTACGKKHVKVKLWTRSIINHFWWACKECKGNPDLLIEMFHSSLLHVLNIHSWGRRTKIFKDLAALREKRPYPTKPVLVKSCYHTTLTSKGARETPWFNVEDEDYKALFKIITKTKYTNDMKKCARFRHTGKLESFHSMKLQFLPKSTGFTMKTSIIMTMLAALQNNVYRLQNTATSYDIRQWSRASKQYVLKTRTIYDNVAFKREIMEEVEANLAKPKISTKTQPDLDLGSYIRQALPKTFHDQTAPSLQHLKEKQRTRMEGK